MTDTEKQSLTEHLAEKVCGFERDEFWRAHGYCMVDGRVFSPLADANDCSLVMAAWRKQGGELDLIIAKRTIAAQAYKRDGFEHEAISDDSWPEAVCLAIARASGWEGSK